MRRDRSVPHSTAIANSVLKNLAVSLPGGAAFTSTPAVFQSSKPASLVPLRIRCGSRKIFPQDRREKPAAKIPGKKTGEPAR